MGEASHYDWLLEDPDRAGELHSLWAARVSEPPDQWARLARWKLTPLQPHRGIYLNYEGPISGDRGSVQRVDEGTFEPVEWNSGELVIDLSLNSLSGRVRLITSDPVSACAELMPSR